MKNYSDSKTNFEQLIFFFITSQLILKLSVWRTLFFLYKSNKQYKLQEECVYLGLCLFYLTLYGLRTWMRKFMANCSLKIRPTDSPFAIHLFDLDVRFSISMTHTTGRLVKKDVLIFNELTMTKRISWIQSSRFYF